MAAHLADESPGTAQTAVGGGDRSIWVMLDPMQYCVGKDGIKFLLEYQPGCVHYPGIKPALSRGGNHFCGAIYTNDISPARDQFFGQDSVAATKIENALARTRLEQ